jgi:hypothetical protein
MEYRLRSAIHDVWIEQETVRQAKGCCGNDSWRGRLCQYHQGIMDGMDIMLAHLRDVEPS